MQKVQQGFRELDIRWDEMCGMKCVILWQTRRGDGSREN